MIAPTRRRRRTLAVVATGVMFMAGCGGGGGSAVPGGGGKGAVDVVGNAPVAPASAIPPGSAMERIKKQGFLTVGGTETAPLFALKDPTTGKTTGFDATMAEMLAKYIIGKPEVHRLQVTAQTRETLLQNGQVDVVIATYTITPARAKLIDFAGPYYSSGDAILVKKSDNAIKAPADLNGKTVVTETNSTAAKDIAQFAPGAKVTLLDTNDECLQAVKQGRADAYVLDEGILAGDVSRNPEVKIVGQPFTQEPYGIGIGKKDDPAFRQFVDDWLKRIEKDGLWAQAWKASIGTVVPGDAPTPPQVGSVPAS